MRINIEKIHVGIYETNCYIVYDGSDAFIVDPGSEAGKIKKVIELRGLNVEFILLTHGHADHIGAVNDFDVPVYVHSSDFEALYDPELNLSKFLGFDIIVERKAEIVCSGSTLNFAGKEINVIHTPGHTPGSTSYLFGNYLFSGDTLFKGTVGRTDFPGGDARLIVKSIKEKILPLGDEVAVLPGHGDNTTIGGEKRKNIFLC